MARITLTLFLAFFCTVANSTGFLSDALKDISNINKETAKVIDETKRNINDENRDDDAISKSVSRIELMIKTTDKKLQEVSLLSKKIEQDKVKIERREQLFSMGFYASLVTTFVAGIGFFVRLPALKLERKLKMLEIEYKTIEISILKNETS